MGNKEGPVTINFTLYGQKKEIHPEYFYDYMDLGILKEINDMIKDSGYAFAAVQLDQEVFVTVLKAEEKRKIQQERYIDFVSLED